MGSQPTTLVNCFCADCHNHLFTPVNAWTKTSNSYFTFSSEQPKDWSETGIVPAFPNRLGSSELEDCTVQPLHCKGCATQTGARCVEAPVYKKQHEGKSFLECVKVYFKTLAGTLVEANTGTPQPSSASSNTILATNESTSKMQMPAHAASRPVGESSSPAQVEDWRRQSETLLQPILKMLHKQKDDTERLHSIIDDMRKEMFQMEERMKTMRNADHTLPTMDCPEELRNDAVTLRESVSNLNSKQMGINNLKSEVDRLKRKTKQQKAVEFPRYNKVRLPDKSTRTVPNTKVPNTPLDSSLPTRSTQTTESQVPVGPAQMAPPVKQSRKRNTKKAPAILNTEEVADLVMSEDAPPLSSITLQSSHSRRTSEASHRPSMTVIANTIQSTPLESLGPGETPMTQSTPQPSASSRQDPRLSLATLGQGVDGSVKGTLARVNTDDTQEYLKRTVPQDDSDDTDFEPSRQSISPVNALVPDEPETQEVSASLNRLLTPVRVVSSPRKDSSGKKAGRPRVKKEKRLPTPEWERDDWEGPINNSGEGYYNYQLGHTSPKASHRSSVGHARRGVSRGLPSGLGSKRQKTVQTEGEARGWDKQRDEEGCLLKADGSRDLRSARKKPKESVRTQALDGEAQSGYGKNHEELMRKIFPNERHHLAAEASKLNKEKKGNVV